ncbi:MAG: hypothetical protein ABSB74_06240 [Tepidisphaeraceae bacterium]
MNSQIELPDWCRNIHANERSKRLRPFAPPGRPSSKPTSYTYPEDYGSKPNSVGWIGDASLAGKTDTQYGTVLDAQQPLYMLADRDIEILLRWMPGGWNETKLQGLLLTEFNRNAAELPSLTWPNIIAILASRTPKPGDGAAATGAKPAEESHDPFRDYLKFHDPETGQTVDFQTVDALWLFFKAIYSNPNKCLTDDDLERLIPDWIKGDAMKGNTQRLKELLRRPENRMEHQANKISTGSGTVQYKTS